MMFVDANVFLRALTQSSLPDVQFMGRIARNLFRRVDQGEIEVTTSEAIIAEVAFVLTSKAHYHLPASDAADRLATVVQMRGVRLRDKHAVLHALELWSAYPKLGFVDALAAAHAQQADIELATFDTDFDGLPGISLWRPVDGEANGHWD